MRKPIKIESAKAGCLFRYCLERASHLDICARVIPTKDGGLVGLTGDMRVIAQYAIQISQDAEQELGFLPEQHETDARTYLKAI